MPKPKEPLDKEAAAKKYLEAGASICPVCESWNISGTSIELDGTNGFQDVDCRECGATWIDVYTLTGVSGIQTKEEQEAA